MTQTFVRYSPAVEQNEPDFDRTLQQVLNDMKQHPLARPLSMECSSLRLPPARCPERANCLSR